MRCALCEESIENYNPELHSLRIDDDRTAAICDECARKFVKWHGEKLAKLFPTSAMKKMRGRRE